MNNEIEEFMNKAVEDKSSHDSGKNTKEEKSAGGYDEMLPQAVEVVLETKSCSVSMLQRRVKLGYSRAARIVDQMEELGIVGPYEGAKPRTVIIDREGWIEIQRHLGLISDGDYDDLIASSSNVDSIDSDADEY
jgi:S-DNA-T family DNA segregation ATPase FtsK/SpoIIIE